MLPGIVHLASCSSTRGALVRNSIALQIDPIDSSSARLHDVNIFVAVAKADGSVLTLRKCYRRASSSSIARRVQSVVLGISGRSELQLPSCMLDGLIDNLCLFSIAPSFCSLGYQLLLFYNTQQIPFSFQLSSTDHHELFCPRWRWRLW